MNVTPLPVYLPGARPFAFRRLLQRIPGAEPRQVPPMRAGRFIVSIQVSKLHA